MSIGAVASHLVQPIITKPTENPSKWNWRDIMLITAVALTAISALAMYLLQMFIPATLFTLLGGPLIVGLCVSRKYGKLRSLNSAIETMSELNIRKELTATRLENATKSYEELTEEQKQLNKDIQELTRKKAELLAEYQATLRAYQRIHQQLDTSVDRLGDQVRRFGGIANRVECVRDQLQLTDAQRRVQALGSDGRHTHLLTDG